VNKATDFSDDDMLASNDGCEAGLVADDPDIAAVDPDFGDDGREIGPLRLNIGVLIFCLLDISDLARHPVSWPSWAGKMTAMTWKDRETQ